MTEPKSLLWCMPGNESSERPYFEAWALYDEELVTSLDATIAIARKRLDGATKKRQREGVVVVQIPPGETGGGWYAATWEAFVEPHEESWVVWRSTDKEE